MKATSLKSLTTKAAVLAAGIALLAGFNTLTQSAERSAERALETVISAPGKLYAEPAAPTVQLGTVVVSGKRSS